MSKINTILLIFISILFISFSLLKFNDRQNLKILEKDIMINLIEKSPINICENISDKYKNEVELISRRVFDSNRAYLNESYNYSGLRSINLLYNSKDNYEFCFSTKTNKKIYKGRFFDFIYFINVEKFLFLQENIKKEECENNISIVDEYGFCFDSNNIIKL